MRRASAARGSPITTSAASLGWSPQPPDQPRGSPSPDRRLKDTLARATTTVTERVRGAEVGRSDPEVSPCSGHVVHLAPRWSGQVGGSVRVLIASVPASGHVNPLLPLAEGLCAAGDEVVFATGPDMCEQLATSPFATAPVGLPMIAWLERLAARTRGRPGDGIAPERIPQWFAPRLFGEVGAAVMVDDLLATAREFAPQAIVYESRCYAAPAVARSIGVLPVLQAVTTLLPPEVEVLVGDAVTPLWRELGLDPPTYAGVFDGLTLSSWPASLDDPSPYGDLIVHRLAPPTVDVSAAPAWLGSWVSDQDRRPIVYDTLGTVFGRNAVVLRGIPDGLAGEDLSVLMTVGMTGNPEALGMLPTNVRLERYVPQEAVLPHCAAVVSHAGSGTTLGALALGLPQVFLPQGADQFINATRCQTAGLGPQVTNPGDSNSVRDAVREVLDEPKYAASTRRSNKRCSPGCPQPTLSNSLNGRYRPVDDSINRNVPWRYCLRLVRMVHLTCGHLLANASGASTRSQNALTARQAPLA